jgi:hypothetical protein
VLTNYLNPILNLLKFWPLMERIVYFVFRVQPSPERELD